MAAQKGVHFVVEHDHVLDEGRIRNKSAAQAIWEWSAVQSFGTRLPSVVDHTFSRLRSIELFVRLGQARTRKVYFGN